jgi:formylglycine-generating enzyme required for sulfatase activity
MKFFGYILAFVLIAFAPSADAASRGLKVTLKASEAAGAGTTGTMHLYGASHALVIGNDDYTNGWPKLSNAVNDAELIAAELSNRGFEVTLKRNLNANSLKRTLEEFYVVKGADPNARLFVWYAGHGHTVGGEGFLVPVDAPDPDRSTTAATQFRLKSLSLRRFGEFVRLAQSKHAYTVFDACFAGTVFNSQRAKPPPAITHATTLPVRQFLTSGDTGQTVSDDGTFRKLFLRAIKGEARADANGDGFLTASELGLFITDRYTNISRTRQTPRSGKLADEDYDRGDFVFKLAAVAPAILPILRSQASNEAVLWQSIQSSTNPAMFDEFLKQFPSGQFAGFARIKLKELQTVAFIPIPGISPPAPSPVKPAVGVFPQRYKPGDVFRDCPGCPELVVIRSGSFMMGSPASEPKRYGDEGPQHRVIISKPFAVGKYEVTQSEWRSVMGTNPSSIKGDRKPMEGVSWNDAQRFVKKLSAKTGKRYRLLSEAEWEYAARAGTTTPFHTGNQINTGQANFYGDFTYNGSSKGQYRKGTVAVGSFPANVFGLHDMHGNVWEWVGDCWNKAYHGAPTDGGIWSVGDCSRRVLRGGSWYDRPWGMRAAGRLRSASGRRYSGIGFRIARTLF